MTDYCIEIGNMEESTDLLSATGTVNSVQCASVLVKGRLPNDPKERQKAIDKGLIGAFLQKTSVMPKAGGRIVSI